MQELEVILLAAPPPSDSPKYRLSDEFTLSRCRIDLAEICQRYIFQGCNYVQGVHSAFDLRISEGSTSIPGNNFACSTIH